MKRRSDEEISAPLYAFDAEVRSQYGCFAGVDEAGRGPLCGPVCVAACILDPENPVYGINDSKKLTEKKREALFDEICEKALAYRIVFVGPEVIDRENILNATMGGMQQAVEELDIVPNLVLVDGNRIPAGLQIQAQPVVKGDATSASIGAASPDTSSSSTSQNGRRRAAPSSIPSSRQSAQRAPSSVSSAVRRRNSTPHVRETPLAASAVSSSGAPRRTSSRTASCRLSLRDSHSPRA